MVILSLFLFFIFGLFVGSFLNVVAYRSIHGGSIFLGHSVCPNCKHNLGPTDLIPLVSFLLLGGRCRYCKKSLSLRYPLAELSTGFLFALTFLHSLTSSLSVVQTTFLLLVVSIFIVLFITDFLDGLIPSEIVFFGVLITLIFRVFSIFNGLQSSVDLLFSIGVGLGPALIFLAIVYFTKEKAMGSGDIFLVFLLGFVLGWPDILVGLFVGFLTGAIVAVMLLLTGKKRLGQAVPLGPFLIVGALIALFWGPRIIGAYLSAIV